MRIVQKRGLKGSLKWIQVLINDHPYIINQQIGTSAIDWVSPLKNDDFAEYRDSDFLKVLGLQHLQDLKKFWPTRGPQWDALGKSDNKYYLVEAKANIPEINSTCQAKSPSSVSKIEQAISDAKQYLNIENGGGWLDRFYQYANRLAHLYFLREKCGVDAELVFVYFCDDPTHISTTREEWHTILTDQKKIMGIRKIEHVTELFINCSEI